MTSVAQHSHDSGIPSRAAANQHANGNRVKHGLESAAISAQPSHASPASSAPVLNLTAIANPFASLSIPLGTGKLKPLPEKPGYNEAHRYYDEMRQYYASKACRASHCQSPHGYARTWKEESDTHLSGCCLFYLSSES